MQMVFPPPPQDTEISEALDTLSQVTLILLTSSLLIPSLPSRASQEDGRRPRMSNPIKKSQGFPKPFNGGRQARWVGGLEAHWGILLAWIPWLIDNVITSTKAW